MVSREFLYMEPSVPIVQFIFVVSAIRRYKQAYNTIYLLLFLTCFNDVLHDPLQLGIT